jgi:hypothetical protein
VAPLPTAGKAGGVKDNNIKAPTLGPKLLQELEAVANQEQMPANVEAIEGKVALRRLDRPGRGITGCDGACPTPSCIEREPAGVAKAVEHRPVPTPRSQSKAILALVKVQAGFLARH